VTRFDKNIMALKKNSGQTLDQFDLGSVQGVETKFTIETFKYAG